MCQRVDVTSFASSACADRVFYSLTLFLVLFTADTPAVERALFALVAYLSTDTPAIPIAARFARKTSFE